MDCSLPGSSVHGILQARITGWVAVSSSRGSSKPRDWTLSPAFQANSSLLSHLGSPQPFPQNMKTNITHRRKCCYILFIISPFETRVSSFNCAQLFATAWTAAHQAPLSMGFSRQGYWSGLPFPFPGDLPHPAIEPGFPALQAGSLLTELPGKPWENTHSFYH